MNISRHAKIRYCERVLHIPDDEVKHYAVQEDDQIMADMNRLYADATHIWTGQMFDHETAKYFLSEDLVLVFTSDESTLITLFRVDFGFPEEVNRMTLHALLEEKSKAELQADQKAAHVLERTDPIRHELMGIEQQLVILREQVAMMEGRATALSAELATANYESQLFLHESERIAKMICNSLDLKRDLLELKPKIKGGR